MTPTTFIAISIALTAHIALLLFISIEKTPAKIKIQSGYETISVKLLSPKAKTLNDKSINQPVLQTATHSHQEELPSINSPQPLKVVTVQPHIQVVSTKVKQKIKIVTKKIVKPVQKKTRRKVIKKSTPIEIVLVQPKAPSPKVEKVSSMINTHAISTETIQNTVPTTTEPPDVIINAQPRFSNKPRYPRLARIHGQQGRVKVRLSVDTFGNSHDVELIMSSQFNRLDEAVLYFVNNEQFEPARINGKAIQSRQLFSFLFVLN